MVLHKVVLKDYRIHKYEDGTIVEGDVTIQVSNYILRTFVPDIEFLYFLDKKEFRQGETIEVDLSVTHSYITKIDIKEKMIKQIWLPPRVNKYILIGEVKRKEKRSYENETIDEGVIYFDCGILLELSTRADDGDFVEIDKEDYILVIGRLDMILP